MNEESRKIVWTRNRRALGSNMKHRIGTTLKTLSRLALRSKELAQWKTTLKTHVCVCRNENIHVATDQVLMENVRGTHGLGHWDCMYTYYRLWHVPAQYKHIHEQCTRQTGARHQLTRTILILFCVFRKLVCSRERFSQFFREIKIPANFFLVSQGG